MPIWPTVLAGELYAESVVIGRDMRLESPWLSEAMINAITGAAVIDIDLFGTEEVYFATSHYRPTPE